MKTMVFITRSVDEATVVAHYLARTGLTRFAKYYRTSSPAA